jgi:alpha-tubulin suppressor-like RCC1 family protein
VSLLAGASAAAASSDVVSAWGANTYGQLGNGFSGDEYGTKVPIPVSELSGAESVAAGEGSGFALLENGTVMAWGNNGAGELGDGTITQRNVPVEVSGLSGVSAIAAGESHTLALLANGTVEAWGYNNYGQLGNGATGGPDTCESEVPCSTTPMPVSGLSEVKAIAAAGNHSLALLKNGTVMAWGDDTWGQLGDGSSGSATCTESLPCSTTPLKVQGLSGVKAISAGPYDSYALMENGTVMAWGVNGSGELGNGSTTGPESCINGVACSNTPVSVSGLSGVTAIAGGGLHGLALLSDGTVKSWGYNIVGQLGNGTTTDSDTPVSVSGLSGVTAVSAGQYDSLALLENGTVMAWGWNIEWELGNISAQEESSVPIPVSGLSGVTAISASESLSLAIGSAPAPFAQVRRLEPYTGEKSGGTSVTITGINFTGATAVKFGTSEAASFTVNSNTSITAVSPPGSGNVDVAVTTPEGTSYTSPRDVFRYGPPFQQEEGPHEGPGEPGEKPVVSDESTSNITEHAATIKADVNPQRTTEITYFVEYGTTTFYGMSAPNPPETIRWATCGLECESEAETPRPVSVNLTELQAATTYHYRVVASNGRGVENYGPDATFTTGSAGAKPTIESVSVSEITEHDATLEAQIDPNGQATTYQFRLGKGCYPAICDAIVDIPLPVENLSSAQGLQSVSLDLNSVGVSLQPNSMYYYSVVATNSAGEAGGNGATFRTPPEPTGETGGAETGAASKISQTGATLGGVVTAWGWREATYVFEYGTTTSYGQSAPVPPGVIGPRATCGLPCGPPHSEQFTVSESLAGLQPNTTYHYRLVSTSNGHTSFGQDAAFTTSEARAEPLIVAPSTTGGGESPSKSGGGQSEGSGTPTGSGTSSVTLGATPLASPLGGATKLSEQKLTRALKQCQKKHGGKRAACERRVRVKYARAAKARGAKR